MRVLHHYPLSPSSRLIRLYLSEKKIEFVTKLELFWERSDALLKLNPSGEVPILSDEDNTVLCGSGVIIEYFEEYDPQYKMFGNTSEARAISRSLERTVDTGVLIPVGMTVHATRSPIGLPPNAEVAAAGLRSARGTLELLNVLMSDGRSYLEGDEPSVADCTLAAALQFGRFGRLSLLDDLDYLAMWDERYRARPAAKNILII